MNFDDPMTTLGFLYECQAGIVLLFWQVDALLMIVGKALAKARQALQGGCLAETVAAGQGTARQASAVPAVIEENFGAEDAGNESGEEAVADELAEGRTAAAVASTTAAGVEVANSMSADVAEAAVAKEGAGVATMAEASMTVATPPQPMPAAPEFEPASHRGLGSLPLLRGALEQKSHAELVGLVITLQAELLSRKRALAAALEVCPGHLSSMMNQISMGSTQN